jgi:cysteinyl-tRNA synthetase
VKKFSAYGKLSKKKLDDLKIGARLEEHPDKKNPYDFALWLKAPKEHLLKWESPWSLGYPGWHIECSAMSMEYLGETLDIHTGGEDHIFPHHENEIAQSEGFTGKPFSNFWFHNRFLLVDGAKMSKSKGNFYRLSDILEKGYQAVDFRLLVISSHYRSTSNFTWDIMDQARKNRKKLQHFIEKLKEIESSGIKNKTEINLDSYQKRINEAMDDDLNTPLALSILFELVSEINKKISLGKFSSEEATATINFWNRINNIFGLIFETTKKEIPLNILILAEQRQAARKNKNFKEADTIRAEIEAKGFLIEDSKDGQKLKKI